MTKEKKGNKANIFLVCETISFTNAGENNKFSALT